MTICILGRQPEIGLAELEALYGATNVRAIGETSALVSAEVDFNRLGGSVKSADLLLTVPSVSRKDIFKAIAKQLPDLLSALPSNGKIKLGISTYSFDISPYALNGEALRLKKIVRSSGRSVRVVPNESPALSSAQTFHNKLTDALGIEILIVRDAGQTLIGRVTNVQDIDSYRIRDRERPKRDAFVGMLPPKLAQIIVNLAVGPADVRPHMLDVNKSPNIQNPSSKICLLDPFCGTGVVLQEALLMGYDVYGTDVSAKMIDFSKKNLDWLKQKQPKNTLGEIRLEIADATDHIWRQPTSFIACETYLGQPLGGQQPSSEKLLQIAHETNAIVRNFLKNISPQLKPKTRLCLAVPAWFVNNAVTHLPIVDEVESLGFAAQTFVHAPAPIIYRREDQTTGRELLVLVKQ